MEAAPSAPSVWRRSVGMDQTLLPPRSLPPLPPFPAEPEARPRQTPDQTRRKKALQGARGARAERGKGLGTLLSPQIPAPHFPSCEHPPRGPP